mmetsp:Transcript_17125/g.22283  ORF Transcript_17125/g.22283 Transcript_17125/m.22283 type:complete len:87 (-) Transcript_17125:1637-1897(-)
MFGARGVEFIKLKSNYSSSTNEKDSADLIVKETRHEKPLPGICFIRDSAVSILVALFCGDEVYSLFVCMTIEFKQIETRHIDENTR